MTATARILALTILLGCLLGSIWQVQSKSEHSSNVRSAEAISRRTAPSIHGRTHIESRVHPAVVAAAIALFSVFGLVAFPGRAVAVERGSAPVRGQGPPGSL